MRSLYSGAPETLEGSGCATLILMSPTPQCQAGRRCPKNVSTVHFGWHSNMEQGEILERLCKSNLGKQGPVLGPQLHEGRSTDAGTPTSHAGILHEPPQASDMQTPCLPHPNNYA